jgi:hypothetical protein
MLVVNFHSVFADEVIDKVIKKLNQSKHIAENTIMPLEDQDKIVKKLKQSKRLIKNNVAFRLNPPRTGQTTCYDWDGSIIGCIGTGQDGDWQMGTPWPTPRFTDNGDGTVTDNQTQLVWLKNASCGVGDMEWQDALSFCNSLGNTLCGLTDGSVPGDWRLPNISELQTLVDRSQFDPPLPDTAGTGKWTEGDPFTNVVSANYWSSTTSADFPYKAWALGMYSGAVIDYDKLNIFYVWPVRGGQ